MAVASDSARWEALAAARTRGDVGDGIASVLALLGRPDVISFAGGFPDPETFPRENIATLGAEDRCTIVRTDALRFVEDIDTPRFDVAFADPPYATELAVELATRWLAMPFAAMLGIEHSSRIELPAGGDTRRYGDTAITFYRV